MHVAQQAASPHARWATPLRRIPGLILSLAIVLLLALLAHRFSRWSPRVIEYPLWAVGLGLIVNLIVTAGGVRGQINQAFRTELYLKTGLVLMGATINFRDILTIGARGIIQALLVVTTVFLVTWVVSDWLRLDQKLKAVMSAAVAICGISAAIAAAGAVLARKEQLAYVTTLVILFALPLMVIQPYLANLMGLSPSVAGAWIGGNIDTTAAVVGAGAIHSEQAMKVASIVKMSQNALIGVVAFLLALHWVVVVERARERPRPKEIWVRFPKFVLGFIAASLLVTLGLLDPAQVKAVTGLRNWFLTLAFVSIGLELRFREVKAIGGRPALAYLAASVFNTSFALGIAWILFGR